MASLFCLVLCTLVAGVAGLTLRTGDNPSDSTGRPLYAFGSVDYPAEAPDTERCATVRMDKSSNSLTVDLKPEDAAAVAWACFTDKVTSTGWSTLKLSTAESMDVPLAVKAYSAGFVEGLLTQSRIADFHSNVASLLGKDTTSNTTAQGVDYALRRALGKWEAYAGGDASREPSDPLRRQAWVALLQLRGLRDGHNLAAFRVGAGELSSYDVLLMNMRAELPAIAEAVNEAANITSSEWERWPVHQPRNSALVKRLGSAGDARDLVVGHVTEGDYSEMSRIFKHYHLNFPDTIGGLAMSSYPGCISSTDDYFVNSNGMVAMSTSMGRKPGGILEETGHPSFLRAITAMRLATSPQQWYKIYSFHPGLAGGKQWLLADYSKLELRTALKNGTLWMVEAFPTFVQAADVSENLREDGYFQSIGEAIFPETVAFLGSGTSLMQRDRSRAAASQLANVASTISTLADARVAMTNSYVDPAHPDTKPVAPRYDLSSDALGDQTPLPAGARDAKVANSCLVSKMAAQARNGPPVTVKGEVFKWKGDGDTEIWPGWPTAGLPDEWNFDWVDVLEGEIVSPLDVSLTECGTGTPAR